MKKVLLPAVTTILTINTLVAADTMREGLWSIRSTVSIGTSKSEGAISLCRNAESDNRVSTKGMSCKITSKSSEGVTRTSEMECVATDTTTRINETVTMTGDNAAQLVRHITLTQPSGVGIQEMTVEADMKYLGTCPAGIQPGDAIDAHGKVTQTLKN
jgi:hypothetical protein